MKYYSTNKKSKPVSFKEAVVSGLADDGGLFMPESIPVLEKSFLQAKNISLEEIGFEVAKQFTKGEISSKELQNIISSSLNFPIPLMPVEGNIFSLELFHGPTLAFKDVGARFMAGIISHFANNEREEKIILTATSGDTGSAVANAFYEKEGVRVIILYPSGGVSALQEKQMTTLGKNITAIEITGTFDDCQSLVKKSFGDNSLKEKINLTSANSINIARLIPQSFYYLFAYMIMKKYSEEIIFSVPCGNFGNLTAGILAKKMGMKATFLAATNANRTFVEYLQNGIYSPRLSVKTISNAMDVGNPSNFVRLLDLYGNNINEIRKDISACSVSDKETRLVIRNFLNTKKYLLDPHSAVAYLGLKNKIHPDGKYNGVFLATAHPAKFKETVEESAEIKMELPHALKECMKKEKSAVKLPADFHSLKEFLMN